jgi:geranylgeranyl diphosphate synthase type 3
VVCFGWRWDSCNASAAIKRMIPRAIRTIFLTYTRSDFVPLVNELGMFFQIRDDYINLNSDQYMLNKSFCEDLTEGKFSFPVIHRYAVAGCFCFVLVHLLVVCLCSIRATPNDSKLLSILAFQCLFVIILCYFLWHFQEILKQKTEDVELKKYALTLMKQTGSFEYTKQGTNHSCKLWSLSL